MGTSRLAVLGGTPTFEEPLHVGLPNLGDVGALERRLAESLSRRRLTNNGPFVQELERRMEERTGARHAIAVCNATAGLEVLARALDLRGEVIVPAFTFVATAHAFRWLGLEPVFADVDPRTHTLDPASAESAITSRTTAIVGVHLWGQPCQVGALEALAGEHGLKLVFDAAHAFGTSLEGTPIGGFGDAEVFSFHATKIVNALEGGVITTSDDALARRIRLMINFGFSGYDQVDTVGTNAKMNEFSAAMGLTSIEAFGRFVAANRSNFQSYQDSLAGVPGFRLHTPDPANDPNHQYVIAMVDEEAFSLSRDEIMRVLWHENVRARRYFYPGCHRMEPYASERDPGERELPVTERLSRTLLALPTGPSVGTPDIAAIAGIVREARSRAPAVRAALADMEAIA